MSIFLIVLLVSIVAIALVFVFSIISKRRISLNQESKQALVLPDISTEELERARQEAMMIKERAKEEAEKLLSAAREEALQIKQSAKQESETLRLDLEQRKKEFEEFLSERRTQISNLEQILKQRENALERREDMLSRREEELFNLEKELRETRRRIEAEQKALELRLASIEEKEREIESLRQKEMLELQRIASMTFQEARQEILKRAEEEARLDVLRLIKQIEEEAKEKAELEAKRIITTSIQKLSSEIAVNYTTASVDLPNNEFKGRIIGREGRNIRTFELLTGVDLIIDDTPDIVTISSFDPLRREIAREALERLIQDGRIHPARIEEVVNEVKREIDDKIRKTGEETCHELGLHDINPGLYYYIGKLYFRTSYSQNVLLHSKEVANLAGLMASELGLNSQLARRAGLLHDIGKAISNETGGSHTDIGVELCKKFGEHDAVLNAIRAHHDEEPVRYPEVALVCAADALSAARPGARRESLELYLKRLEKLEEIVRSFKGVQNVYAMQAGREVRVIVNPEELSDEEAYGLSRSIARKIEEQLQFPGQIKVVVIRETRHVEVAK
ncbi:MAG: ribonuclease Y [Aquificaceae bacterium]|nr:ribonuclease Y [Aquificaceae bacterium]MDW8237514.1 ribonuclease Y [Aquificaceae bacterium]